MADPTPKVPFWRRWFGSRSERAAAKFLKKLGHRVLVRNYSCSLGELDLITLDQRCLVFVEVRSTEREGTERPIESIGPIKQQRLTQLALAFMQKRGLLGCSARFDILAISWPPGKREPVIEHYPNAFEPVGRFQMYS